MDCTASVVGRTYREPGVDERRLFPRKAIDPDAALVAQLRRAEAGAAEALVGAYGDRVYRLAIRITGNASDAEEVIQDAFSSVLRNIGTFRGDASLGSWIYRITTNLHRDELRRRKGRFQEEIPEEIEVRPSATKAEAMERLARAVEAWKRARDSGWKVGDIRKTVKVARDAVDAGDYEEAIRLAMEILDQLQATASAR